ncbi:family 78 glycoside hydrolase catalytic domain [Arthrobacter sp. NtRootA1]|uniref:family 78 glycoside hydrolase catalytic domain n=1 Tax=Arthrobacter sp. NtRootA1 TaxID=2830983 RepID=UPI001CC3ECD7|nr:family 78 glycoside hydrolase catalytic domain [Arthrobacter sp. NtRootA1]BCW06055.1 alpha-L-rhamnosidase [Arthrobacter sp. NtRootA1]
MAYAAAPQGLRFEQRTETSPVIGLGTGTPRLSWFVPVADAGYAQSAYEVEVTRGEAAEVYRVQSNDQVLVPWPAPELQSRESAVVRIRVSDGEDWSGWSEASTAETGLLNPSDWRAEFVSPVEIGANGMPAPILSGVLNLPADIIKARLYATAHGIYVPTLNGQRIDDTVLAPGWTSYENRLRYQTYDVTSLLRKGTNNLDMLLGNGWYRGRLGFENKSAIYGERLAVLAQLEVSTADGGVHVLLSDSSWTARNSNILADDLYDGQSTDLRDQAITVVPRSAVEVIPADHSLLVAPEGPAIRPTEVLPAVSVFTSRSGKTLVDFGQNLVGWVRLRTHGLPEGSEVVIQHAEVLENDELCTEPLRTAKATDTFVVAGAAEETLEPSLTLHGFRYAQVSGVPDLKVDDIEAVVIGSDLRRIGWFSSSNELLNRFHENVNWSIRGNFVDVPTDCPQRDERLGWTGDIQIFAPTASFLYDVGGFLGSWLRDLAAEQLPDGSVPHVVPDVIHSDFTNTPTAAWGDAAVLIPWTLYQRTGNRLILEQQYSSACKYVDKVASLAGDDMLWTGGFQYGDWLDPSAPPEDSARAKTDPDVVATAHLARSAEVLAHTAAVLGRDEDAAAYYKLAEEVRAAFARSYVTPSGRILSDTQTAYAMALEWALLPSEDQRHEAGRRLADLVRVSGFRISTGFVGTPLVCDALTDAGEVDVAYRLLLQTGCPSWLYPVTMGATTVWERWDSLRPDGSVNPGGMTSFNHYALGAVADWLHRTVAGLAPAAPGYRKIIVQPRPTAALTSAAARHLTPYGEASVQWRRVGGKLILDVAVPVGTTAVVHVPGTTVPEVVPHGTHTWTAADPSPNIDEGNALTIRELLDRQPLTWSAVVDAAVETGIAPEGEAQTADKLARYLDEPVGNLGYALAPEPWISRSVPLREKVEQILKGSTS